MAEAPKPKVRVRLYRFRNRLKDKAAGLGGDVPLVLDEALLAQAEQLFEDMAEDYPDWVSRQLEQLLELHRRCVDTPDARRSLFEQINAIAHDMKGQGGTFGYGLVTTIATSLNRFSSLRTAIQDRHVEIIKAHIDAMRAVIRDRLKADGGETGMALVKGLETVISRFDG